MLLYTEVVRGKRGGECVEEDLGGGEPEWIWQVGLVESGVGGRNACVDEGI